MDLFTIHVQTLMPNEGTTPTPPLPPPRGRVKVGGCSLIRLDQDKPLSKASEDGYWIGE